MASHCSAFSVCRTWALEHANVKSCSRASLPLGVWNLLHRNWTRVPCIGRQLLYHQAIGDVSCSLLLENDISNIHVGAQYAQLTIHGDISPCIPAHLWTYSVKGNLWWCLQPDPPRHGHCNVSFCLSGTLPSNGKIPGFHRLSYTEFSACPTWLLKKKKTVRLSFKGGSACIAPVSWVCFCMIVYYQYTLSGQVSISVVTNYEWACLL